MGDTGGNKYFERESSEKVIKLEDEVTTLSPGTHHSWKDDCHANTMSEMKPSSQLVACETKHSRFLDKYSKAKWSKLSLTMREKGNWEKGTRGSAERCTQSVADSHKSVGDADSGDRGAKMN